MPEQSTTTKNTAARAVKLDAAPLDFLRHLAFNSPLLTHRQRADRVKWQQTAFFNDFAPGALAILRGLLEKYGADGEVLFALPDVMKIPPISSRGNVNAIMSRFGGAANLRNSVNQLQSLLYAA